MGQAGSGEGIASRGQTVQRGYFSSGPHGATYMRMLNSYFLTSRGRNPNRGLVTIPVFLRP